ncbi:MAG: transglutaminase-like cysteine peptidase [Dongiaceae bacterium]
MRCWPLPIIPAALGVLLLCSAVPSPAAEDTVVALLRDSVVPNVALHFPKWERARSWLTGPAGADDPALAGWVAWTHQLAQQPVRDRLVAIQRRVDGSFRYRSDQDLFGVRDYWETPDQVVRLGAADCDGFAIFKFWAARLAGVPDDALALLIGFRSDRRAMHAVLLVADGGHDDVLDLLEPAVIDQPAYFAAFRPVALFTLDDVHYFRSGRRPERTPAVTATGDPQ